MFMINKILNLGSKKLIPDFTAKATLIGHEYLIHSIVSLLALASLPVFAHSLAGKSLAEKISLVPGGGIAVKEFSLVDLKGSKVSYPQIAIGEWSVVYFGFTNCKSACPMTAAYLRAELSAWPEESRPQVVFISVDPVNDKPTVLQKWLSSFDGGWMGLTGTKFEIEQAARPFGVSHGMNSPSDPNVKKKTSTSQNREGKKTVTSGTVFTGDLKQTPEEVMHSSYLYVVDPSGQWRAYLPAPAKKGVLKEGLISLGVPSSRRKSG